MIFLVVVGVVSFFNGSNDEANVLNYGEFQTKLDNGEIQELTIQPERGVYTVKGQLTGDTEEGEENTFVTNVPDSEKQ